MEKETTIYDIKKKPWNIKPGIDRNLLARQMLRWREWQAGADELAAAIRGTVLQLGETVTTGTIRATFRKGRKSYDYAGAAASGPKLDPDVIERHTKTITKTDWRKVCNDEQLADIPYTESNPSVTLKVIF